MWETSKLKSLGVCQKDRNKWLSKLIKPSPLFGLRYINSKNRSFYYRLENTSLYLSVFETDREGSCNINNQVSDCFFFDLVLIFLLLIYSSHHFVFVFVYAKFLWDVHSTRDVFMYHMLHITFWLFGLYGILTFAGYLTPNSVYMYTHSTKELWTNTKVG